MDNLNTPITFSEDEALFAIFPKEWLQPSKYLEETRNSLENNLNNNIKAVRMTFESSISEINNPKEISDITKEVERLRLRESELEAAISDKKQSLAEVLLKKKSLEDCGNDNVSEEELTVLLKEVISLEKEDEIRKEYMKEMKRKLVGKICFYEEYLGVYIDVFPEHSYTVYFSKCQGWNVWRPKAWIRIQTDNFKDYIFHDICLPEDSNKRLDLMKQYEEGIHLRTLIYKARKYCS